MSTPETFVAASAVPRICIIDDDDAVRDSLRDLLHSHGYEVKDFASALDFLSGGHAASEQFDCAIVDLQMPGLTGLELFDIMQRHACTLPFVMITGRADSALKDRARRRGVVAMLDKPVGENALIDAISKANTVRTARGHA